MIPYKFIYKMTKDWDRPMLIMHTGSHQHDKNEASYPVGLLGGMICQATDGAKRLLEFVNSVIAGTDFFIGSTNFKGSYYTEVYAAQVVQQDGKKMLKIFFHMSDDYEPYYIDTLDFKELLEIWIKEKAKFDADPVQYKLGMIKNGATVVYYEDQKEGGEGIDEQSKGLIIVSSRREKRALEKYRDAYQAGNLKIQERIGNKLREQREKALKAEDEKQQKYVQEEIKLRKRKESVIRSAPRAISFIVRKNPDTKHITLAIWIDLRNSKRPELYYTIVEQILSVFSFKKRKELLADLNKFIHGDKTSLLYSVPNTLYADPDAHIATVQSEILNGETLIRFTDDKPPYFCYITPTALRTLLERWVAEGDRFLVDPEKYKEKLKKSGGIVEEF